MSKLQDHMGTDQDQTHRDYLARAVRATRKPKGTRIEKLVEIVKAHSAGRIDGVLVDVQTAQRCLGVHTALSVENQTKFVALPMARMGAVAWKLT